MKKPITIWTLVLSLMLVAGINVAMAQGRINATSNGTTATTESVVEKTAPEAIHLQAREQRLLQTMNEEERLIYQRKKLREAYENQGTQGMKQSSQPQLTTEQQREIHLQKKANMRTAQNESSKVEIPLSKFNDYPDSRKKFIQDSPDKYFINNSK